jgi:hypothetical protein
MWSFVPVGPKAKNNSTDESQQLNWTGLRTKNYCAGEDRHQISVPFRFSQRRSSSLHFGRSPTKFRRKIQRASSGSKSKSSRIAEPCLLLLPSFLFGSLFDPEDRGDIMLRNVN